MSQQAITPTRAENYPEWYQSVIQAADLAESSPVRGCMVIKPWGYALWENMQKILDEAFKKTGHSNAYFPLLIPVSFLEKEAEHVEGFAKECAVVTHHRLKADAHGKLIPDGILEEPMVIRPTSETIIGHHFAKWVQSYRDLPILINQWCNVMRWEMRTRLFLRTAEFLWQEGHTAHATRPEAEAETRTMLEIYRSFAEDVMAMPVIAGQKTPDERFPGAVETYTIEAMMQDRKALQAGTSHFLGQNFAKASEIKFQSEQGEIEYAWTTSWGVSTRLIGGLVMTHSDDNGLVLPPRLAPLHIVVLPIYRNDDEKVQVMTYINELTSSLNHVTFAGETLRIKVDTRDKRGGDKTWQWIKQGVPLRVEIGPRDVAKDEVFLARRDLGVKEKQSVPRGTFLATVSDILTQIQNTLFERAKNHLNQNSRKIISLEELEAFFANEEGGGFAWVPWCESAVNHEVFTRFKISPRCIPLDSGVPDSACIFTGNKASHWVVIGRSY
jgi:prolyl-tRNA synthetase